jgi:mannose-1-phosphate guanylyltransferase
MMTFRSETPKTCGIVELDTEGVVVGFHEKVANPPGNLANGAIYILSPELIHTLATEPHEVSDFSTEVLQRLVGRIYTYETLEYFIDIGSPESFEKANSK